MDDPSLLRYSRHILLEEFGIDGQSRVSSSRALIIGAGGLGSPAALYLAAAGVGRITLVDDDAVDLTNLQRQVAHAQSRIGQAKVDSAAAAMKGINPTIEVLAIPQRAEGEALAAWVEAAEVVLDCSDNFATRHAVNEACVRAGRPLVAGAAIRFDGQLSVFDPRDARSPCYACVFPPDAAFEETRCAVLGVLGPVVGIIGALQANEALKLLAGIAPSMVGRLLLFDGLRTEFDSVRVARDPECPVCRARAH